MFKCFLPMLLTTSLFGMNVQELTHPREASDHESNSNIRSSIPAITALSESEFRKYVIDILGSDDQIDIEELVRMARIRRYYRLRDDYHLRQDHVFPPSANKPPQSS